jgi:hypothetical protein
MKEYVDTAQQAQITMSYFRKANPDPQYVQKLRSDDCIFSEEDVILQNQTSLLPEGQCIKLLFFNDEEACLHMMIGTGAKSQSDQWSSSSDSGKSAD